MENKYRKDEILDSLRGIRKAEPNPFLFTRIEAKLNRANHSVISSQPTLRMAFALSAILVIVNVSAVISHARRATTHIQEASPYSLNSDRYDLY